ncbi:MAG: hypothetical protein KGJ11_09285 [Candidatus Omnitrophica bacterium]|nr:hypothetical protein [Candidatus Omnitrophota bacterium]
MKEILGSILKIACFILVIPILAAIIIAFQDHVLALPVHKEACLLWGAGVYVGLNLFVYDFKKAFEWGKALIEKMVSFFKSAVYLVPVYSLIIVIVYLIAAALGRGNAFQPYFLFILGFTFTMHLVLTAHEIYGSDKSPLKSQYLLVFSAVLASNLIIISLLLTLTCQYSFVGFVKSIASHTSHFYKSSYKLLFVDS